MDLIGDGPGAVLQVDDFGRRGRRRRTAFLVFRHRRRCRRWRTRRPAASPTSQEKPHRGRPPAVPRHGSRRAATRRRCVWGGVDITEVRQAPRAALLTAGDRVGARPPRPRRPRAGPEVFPPTSMRSLQVLGQPRPRRRRRRCDSRRGRVRRRPRDENLPVGRESARPSPAPTSSRTSSRPLRPACRSSPRRTVEGVHAVAAGRPGRRRVRNFTMPAKPRHPRHHQPARTAPPNPAHAPRHRGRQGARRRPHVELVGNERTLPRTKLLQQLKKHRGRAAFRGSAWTVKQHLAVIRMLRDWLVLAQLEQLYRQPLTRREQASGSSASARWAPRRSRRLSGPRMTGNQRTPPRN